jgi:murein L,D-transpeptidase YafK
MRRYSCPYVVSRNESSPDYGTVAPSGRLRRCGRRGQQNQVALRAFKEIYALARETFHGGNSSFQLQLLPFRMTEANLSQHAESPHAPFWRDLKVGTDLFDAARRPPTWDVCERRYVFSPNGSSPGPLNPNGVCPTEVYSTMAAL